MPDFEKNQEGPFSINQEGSKTFNKEIPDKIAKDLHNKKNKKDVPGSNRDHNDGDFLQDPDGNPPLNQNGAAVAMPWPPREKEQGKTRR